MRRAGLVGKVGIQSKGSAKEGRATKVNKTVKSPFREEGKGYKEFKIDLRKFEDNGEMRFPGTGQVIDGVDFYMLGYTRSTGKPSISEDARISVFWGDGTVWHVGRDDKLWKTRHDLEYLIQQYEYYGFSEELARSQVAEGYSDPKWDVGVNRNRHMSLRHEYPSSGEYTIKILGDKDFVDSISFAAGSISDDGYSTDGGDINVYNYAYQSNQYNHGSVLTDIIAADINIQSSFFRHINLANLGTKGLSWIKNKISSGEWYYELNGEKKLIPLYGTENISLLANEIENIDLSEIDSLENFLDTTDIDSSIDVSGWDVSGVTSMVSLFADCLYVGKSQDLSSWDTSSVTILNSFASMIPFQYTNETPFTSTSISSWNLNSLESCRSMFSNHRDGDTGNLTNAEAETILKGWADNSNTADNVDATGMFGFGAGIGGEPRVYASGSDMDLAVTALTNKGWTITRITIE